MPGEHQISRFGYYDIEDSPEPDFDPATARQLSRDWNQKKYDRKEYSKLRSKGLSHVRAYLAAFNKCEVFWITYFRTLIFAGCLIRRQEEESQLAPTPS